MSLVRADARRLPLVDDCVQMCVTSPPYWGLRDYGGEGQIGLETTPEAYIAELVTVFEEVRRVLKPDGVLWMNLGDCYAGGHAGRNDVGRTISDRGGNYRHDGIGPSIVVPRPIPESLKPKDLVGVPWMVAFALRASGWYLRSGIIWSKPNPMPESVTDRPTKAHEYLFLLSKSERYFYNAQAIADQSVEFVRTPNRPRVDPSWRKGVTDERIDGVSQCGVAETRNKRSVWTVPTHPYAGAHFATFPPALIEPCILAGSRPGDLVLDPFIGSGTVGAVCERLGRRWVGTDLNYQHLSKKRTRQRGLRFIEGEATA